MATYKKIGILGGIGAEATADFYMKIIKLFQTRLNAKYSSDFPEIVINSINPPTFSKTIKEIKKLKSLINGCKLLESSKVDFIAIPCNSAHKFIGEMRKSVKVPILSIVEETVKEVKKQKVSNVLILATNYTINNKLYESILINNKIVPIIPKKHQQIIAKIIVNILKGKHNSDDKKELLKIIDFYKKRVDGVVLACTEFPLIINKNDVNIRLFDTNYILAVSSFNYCIN